jgi:hypothetical protein
LERKRTSCGRMSRTSESNGRLTDEGTALVIALGPPGSCQRQSRPGAFD